jgi:hypothetical protein
LRTLSAGSLILLNLMFSVVAFAYQQAQDQTSPSSEEISNQISLSYGIDPHAVVFERGSDGLEHANVDCLVQAYSEKGKLVNSVTSTVKSSLHPETYERILQSGFPCKNQIVLPTESYLLRLAVRDNRSGLIGTATGKITLPLPLPQLIRP